MSKFSGGALPAALRRAALGAAAALLVVGSWTMATRRERRQSARLHRTLVELLLNALRSGDPDTARHSTRVANLADALAEAMRLPRREHATLRVAALLHDLGKMDERLFPLVHSPNPLTPEERGQINRHPSESAAILEPLEPFHPGLTRIVSAHHECWNGGGYPAGLGGEEIPLAARIISVADVFDALTQPRTYHDPVPVGEVLERIRASAGQRFDPEVVALLEEPQIHERWISIAEEGRREEEEAIRAARREARAEERAAVSGERAG